MKAVLQSFSIALLLVTLIGCASWQGAYFDENEYGSLARIESQSRMALEQCRDPKAVMSRLAVIRSETEYLFTYTRFLSNNNQLHEIASKLNTQITVMQVRYEATPPSRRYCETKLTIFTKGLQRALKAAASKRRQ